MTIGTTRPGLSAALLSPYVPIGYTASGLPVFGVQGARGGSRVDFIVDGNADDDGDPFAGRDDDDDDDDDDGEDDELPASMRRRTPKKRTSRKRTRDDDGEPGAIDFDTDDDEGDEGDERDEDWTPPDRASYERMEEALARANKDQRNRRWVAKTMRSLDISSPEEFNAFLLDRGIDPSTGNRLDLDDADNGHESDADEDAESDERPNGRKTAKATVEAVRRAELRATARTEEQYKPALGAFAAEAALMAMGFRKDRLKSLPRALRLLDLDAVDVEFDDKTGDPVLYGLEEQLTGLRTDFPEWFEQQRSDDEEDSRPRPRQRGGARQVDGGDRRRPKPRPKGWLEQLDERIVGGR